MSNELVWDDEMWDLVWERRLDQVDRHTIAMAVLRRRPPRDPFQWRVATELANRWARSAAWFATLYLTWSLFWAAIGWPLQQPGEVSGLALGCTAAGVVAAAGCLAFRERTRRFRSVLLAAGMPRGD